MRGGFATVGGLLERQRVRAATAEAMRLVGEANAYVSRTEPFRLKGDDERERLGTVLHVLAQVVSDLNVMLSPFLPHSANAIHRVLGGEGDLVPMPRLEEVDDLDGGPGYPVITGDYSADAAAGRRGRSCRHAGRQARPRCSASSTRRVHRLGG